MNHTVVIVNPAAGNGRSGRRWAERSAGLGAALGKLVELPTLRPGHATELCRSALESGARLVVAVGGDGTWHETVAGFFAAGKAARNGAALACYPAGSGCDFARHFRFPPEGPELLAVLKARRIRRIDVVRGTITEHGRPRVIHLTNMAAFGLGGDVAEAVARFGKPLGGTLSYLAATAALLLRSRARPFEIVLDGKPLCESGYHTVLLGNTSMTGGGMLFAPAADAEDGLLDVITVGPMSRLSMMRKLGMLYNGKHIGQQGIGAHQGRRLEVRTGPRDEGRAPLNIDGEACGSLPAVFEVLPGVLPVIAP